MAEVGQPADDFIQGQGQTGVGRCMPDGGEPECGNHLGGPGLDAKELVPTSLLTLRKSHCQRRMKMMLFCGKESNPGMNQSWVPS